MSTLHASTGYEKGAHAERAGRLAAGGLGGAVVADGAGSVAGYDVDQTITGFNAGMNHGAISDGVRSSTALASRHPCACTAAR